MPRTLRGQALEDKNRVLERTPIIEYAVHGIE